MADWQWFGWALAGAAFTAAAAGYVGQQLFHFGDMGRTWTLGVVFVAVLTVAIVRKIRFEARCRQYLLSEDYERWASRDGEAGRPRE